MKVKDLKEEIERMLLRGIITEDFDVTIDTFESFTFETTEIEVRGKELVLMGEMIIE